MQKTELNFFDEMQLDVAKDVYKRQGVACSKSAMSASTYVLSGISPC